MEKNIGCGGDEPMTRECMQSNSLEILLIAIIVKHGPNHMVELQRQPSISMSLTSEQVIVPFLFSTVQSSIQF